jgi:hypothetical protein
MILLENLKELASRSSLRDCHASALLLHGKVVSYGINTSQICLKVGTLAKHAEHSALTPLLKEYYILWQ